MGVAKAFQIIDANTSGRKVTPKEDCPNAHLDGSSLLYSRILKVESALLVKDFRKSAKLQPTLKVVRERVAPILAKSINRTLDNTYNKSNNVHFDGPGTIQKKFAHSRRAKSRGKGLHSFQEIVKAINDRLDVLEAKPAVSRGQLSRIFAMVKKSLVRSWKAIRKVDQTTLSELARILKADHGWNCHTCTGQMDICIAKEALADKEIVAISQDSDLLFTGIKTLVRFKPKGNTFVEYPVKKIFTSLGIKSLEAWIACAVLTLNDYDSSAARQSFGPIVKAVSDIYTKYRHSKDRTAIRLVEIYCQEQKVSVTDIHNSVESFIELREDLDPDHDSSNDKVDEAVRAIFVRVEGLRSR